jgi:pentatricopeptide repeat protein
MQTLLKGWFTRTLLLWAKLKEQFKTLVFIYSRHQRIKTCLETLQTLGSTEDKIEAIAAINTLARTKIVDLEMEKGTETALLEAYGRFGEDITLHLCQVMNERTTDIYGLFHRLLKLAYKVNRQRMLTFVTKAKPFVAHHPIALPSVFYALKTLVYNLIDSNLHADSTAVLSQVIHEELFSLTSASCMKPVCSLLELLVRNNLSLDPSETPSDKVGLNDFISVIHLMPIKPPEVFFNKVLDLFAKSKRNSRSSELILEAMIQNKIRASLVTFNTLLEIYINQKNIKMAWYLFNSLIKNDDPKPDSYTFCTMMSGLRQCQPVNVSKIEEIYHMYTSRHQPDPIVINCLLDVYMITDNEEKALTLLEETKSEYNILPDEATYNTLIKGCAKQRSIVKAENYLKEMKAAGLRPNKVTYNSLMDICVKNKKLNKALLYLREMTSFGCQPDHFSYSIIFTGMKSSASQEIYQQCISHLMTLLPTQTFHVDEVFFNAIMDVACKFRDTEKVEDLLTHMKSRAISPSSVTLGILVKTYGRAKMIGKVREVYHEMINTHSLQPNDIFYGSLIEAFISCDSFHDAESAFKELRSKKIRVNQIILSTMIKGYLRVNMFSAAFDLFEEFRFDQDFDLNLVCYNSILDVAVKSRDLELAREYFDDLHDKGITPDLITYSILIKGYCQQKNSYEAVELLKQMISEKLTPDLPIFNNLLETCSNFTDYGKGFFVYSQLLAVGCQPNLITFGILVKLYGFSREVTKAFDLLSVMEKLGIYPSLIFFTNLMHISLANRKPLMAVKALDLLDEYGIKPDQFCADKLLTGLAKWGKDPSILSQAKSKLAYHGLNVGKEPPGLDKNRKPLRCPVTDSENMNNVNNSSPFCGPPVQLPSKSGPDLKAGQPKVAELGGQPQTPAQSRTRQFGVDCSNLIKKQRPPGSSTVKSTIIR